MDECICNLSKGEEKLISNGSWVDLYMSLKDGEYWIEAISDGRVSMRIDYCPKCGRKLVEEVEDDDLSDYL